MSLPVPDTLGLAERHQPFPPGTLHPVTRVRVDTPLDDTLTALRADGSHLAAVTGGTGTVLGFVTMEDVLSELVGPARPDGASSGAARSSGTAPFGAAPKRG